jgi:Amt family ammonium transporter
VSKLKPMLGYDDARRLRRARHRRHDRRHRHRHRLRCQSLGGPSKPDYDMGHQLLVQVEAVATTIVWAAIGTVIAIYIAKLLTGLRVSPEVEQEGLDIGEHGERAYNH